jgi:hypothetical protein
MQIIVNDATFFNTPIHLLPTLRSKILSDSSSVPGTEPIVKDISIQILPEAINVPE